MIFTWPTYPTKWRWRFALIPVGFGERKWLWLEPYQIREVSSGSWQRRDSRGNVIEFSYGP